MTLPASDFPYVIQHEVIFHDIDVMGHVNNSNFFIFMETARTKYLTKFIELNEDLGALPVILETLAVVFCRPPTMERFNDWSWRYPFWQQKF